MPNRSLRETPNRSPRAMPNPSPRATLSAFELTALSPDDVKALRRVAFGLGRFLPSVQRVRLATLGFVAVKGRGRLVLTQAGKGQLAKEGAAHWPGITIRPSPRPSTGRR
jgi:hypothetical protein